VRAERLMTALLFLQARGKVTAAELAEELEVSVKTARRDLEALAAAGVPLYSLPGCRGGWQLVGGARTDLTGLSEPETRALFFLVGPAAEVSPAAKTALRKLLQALPAPFRDAAWASSSTVVVDDASWGGVTSREPRHLDALRHAIVERRRVELGYADRTGRTSTRAVSPLGVVKKGPTWYLLADTDEGQRTFRVSRVQADLRVRREHLTPLRYQFGDDLEIGAELPDGRFDVSVAGTGITMLAQQLAGWGTTIDVVGPTPLRDALLRIGRELLSRDSA
jgi:predicted DNA-binding transcriptional regulator YafY